MAIQFPVAPGTILLCDYDRGGFQPPEMVKRRLAVVISPRLAHRDGLSSVVPLSTTPPHKPVAYGLEIELPGALPPPFDDPVMWAKCDMVSCVSHARLDLIRGGRTDTGQRKYIKPRLASDVFEALQTSVLAGLGITR